MTTENECDATKHIFKHIKMQFSQEDERLFQREYMNVPQQEDPLRKFAEEYHRRCDEYDSIICTGRHKGEAVAATMDQAHLSNRNARSIRDEIAVREHLSIRDLQNAIHHYRPEN